MFLINYVTPEAADGDIAKAYKTFPENLGVPSSFQLFSASPGLLVRQSEVIKYYMGQEELSFHLLAAIRFIAAGHYCHDYCVNLNTQMLLAAGMSQEEIEALKEDPTSGFIEEEAALIRFVSKSLDSPNSIVEDDVNKLRELGWSDTAIFDAVSQAANMGAASHLFNTFKI